jgi:hypothetical protein
MVEGFTARGVKFTVVDPNTKIGSHRRPELIAAYAYIKHAVARLTKFKILDKFFSGNETEYCQKFACCAGLINYSLREKNDEPFDMDD